MNQSTVLIAEDNPDDFLLLERAFRRADIRAALRWVRDGSEAQAYISGKAEYADRTQYPLPSLILADLKMPRMDGFELLTWVRSKSDLRRIPVVMLTSSSQGPDINKAYDMGANSYLVKPGKFEDLIHLSQQLKSYWLTLNQRPDLPAGQDSP
jgi:CheY-like chemotaxis protein